MTDTDQKWAVLLHASHGLYAYGPFESDQLALAERFAAFLTAEVDPAYVVPLSQISRPTLPVTWKSPLAELLNWRDHVKTDPSLLANRAGGAS